MFDRSFTNETTHTNVPHADKSAIMQTPTAAWIKKRRSTLEYDLYEVMSWQPEPNTGEVAPRTLEILRASSFRAEIPGLDLDSEPMFDISHHTPHETPLPAPMILARLRLERAE